MSTLAELADRAIQMTEGLARTCREVDSWLAAADWQRDRHARLISEGAEQSAAALRVLAAALPGGERELRIALRTAANRLAAGDHRGALASWPGLRAWIEDYTSSAGAQRQPRPEPDEASLVDRAVAVLTPNQAIIFRHLWRVKTAGYAALKDVPGAWRPGMPSDEAVEKQMKRIKLRLEESRLPVGYITISPVKRTVTIEPAD
jgi:hypothetical protein